MTKRFCKYCAELLDTKQKRFCSVACHNHYQTGRPNGRKRQHIVFCTVCTKRYSVKKSKLERTKFCSRKCQGVYSIGNRNKNVELIKNRFDCEKINQDKAESNVRMCG